MVDRDPKSRTKPNGGDSGERRKRLIAAFSKAAGERGYAGLDLTTVSRYAGISEEGLHEQFENLEQVLMAAQDAFLERLWLDVSSACETDLEWPQQVRVAVTAVLSSLVEASDVARVFAIEAPAASLAVAERQFVGLERFAALLRDGRRLYPRAQTLPAVTERAIVGGIASIVSGHLLAEDPRAIPQLEAELVELVLIPYLGEGEARRVAVA
ncbi:MAG TPA: TetR/AcrR family transcriptional regulator [Solirubrobacterales bacterium]|nr:TetR/AcrR family transcriptional regulator [Solirubrobacterales bacterium]